MVRRVSFAHPVDIHVGGRVWTLRRRRGLSLEQLAEQIDVSDHQLHKYESGANRIAASRLYAIAQALGVSVEDFFEGLPDPAQSSNRPDKGGGQISAGSRRSCP